MRPASSSSFALHHNHRRRPLPPEGYCPTMGKRSTHRCQCHGSPAVDAATFPAHRRGTLRQCNRRYEECLASNCRLCRDSDLKANVLPAPPPLRWRNRRLHQTCCQDSGGRSPDGRPCQVIRRCSSVAPLSALQAKFPRCWRQADRHTGSSARGVLSSRQADPYTVRNVKRQEVGRQSRFKQRRHLSYGTVRMEFGTMWSVEGIVDSSRRAVLVRIIEPFVSRIQVPGRSLAGSRVEACQKERSYRRMRFLLRLRHEKSALKIMQHQWGSENALQ